VIAATHDGEPVDLLAGSYRPCHFGDAVVDDGIVFDHRLKSGRATSRNAIALLYTGLQKRSSHARSPLPPLSIANAPTHNWHRGVATGPR
jgi:hypothetical protein